MRIVYQGAEDAREIVGLGLIVKRGEAFECPDHIAGHYPDKRWLDLQLVDIPAAIAALDHPLRVQLLDELIECDPGAGLLAQWPSFVIDAPEQAAPAAKRAPKSDPEQAAPAAGGEAP